MAIMQTRTAAKKKMVGRAQNLGTAFPWINSAQARKIGLVEDGGKYFLGDLRLTASNFATILTQLKALGKVVVGRSAVH
jgi:hypothetical protein